MNSFELTEPLIVDVEDEWDSVMTRGVGIAKRSDEIIPFYFIVVESRTFESWVSYGVIVDDDGNSVKPERVSGNLYTTFEIPRELYEKTRLARINTIKKGNTYAIQGGDYKFSYDKNWPSLGTLYLSEFTNFNEARDIFYNARHWPEIT